MKYLKLNLILSSLLAISCVQSDGEAPTTSATGTTATTTTTKAMLSSWSVSNRAWAVRLDLNSANLDGTSFTLVYKFSDASETWCTAALNGNELTGTYTTSSCTAKGSNTSMSNSVNSVLNTIGTGSYSNTGSVLSLCLHSGSCISYY